MTKQRKAILYGAGAILATSVIFGLMPKPVMFGKLYLQFAFVILAQLICVCGYVLLPERAHHLKSATLAVFLVVELVLNVFLANFMTLVQMIGVNVVLLCLLGGVVVAENYYLE